VIVEASGVATPAGVLDALKYYRGQGLTSVQTVTLIDAARFVELHEVATPLIEAQIAGADRLVVTKVDEATAAEVDGAIATARLLAPAAPVYAVDATDDDLWAPLLADVLREEERA
jgi:G3E family GTPase